MFREEELMKEKVYSLTVFLMKEFVQDYRFCIKDNTNIEIAEIKEEYEMKGIIGVIGGIAKTPQWKNFLQNYTEEPLDISNNISNKAIMVVSIKDRMMVLTFGYGRAFIREECIEKNFGFFTALNMLDSKKIRSINAAKIEDMVVQVQKQSSYSAGQEEFDLNIINDIMTSVAGKAQNPVAAINVSGRDSLQVSVEMEPSKLKEKLELYLEAYNSKNYMRKGFAWIDNVKEVRDSKIKENLIHSLTRQIEMHEYDKIQIAPPDTINWNTLKGFAFSGVRANGKEDKFTIDIRLEDYLSCVKAGTQVCQKLKRDKLLGMDNDDNIYTICSVYAALTAQINLNNKTYILYDGRWFQVENNFYMYVKEYVSRIPVSNLPLPKCGKEESEGEYNERVANKDEGFYLMDKKMIGVDGGAKQIEACDIFTITKQFIHIKNKCRSSQLSHLFAQGKVSAECFVSDKEFRKQISELLYHEAGMHLIDYTKKPKANEYEVVFVILDHKCGKIEDRLPFFSLVNLMLAVQELDRMHMKYAIQLVKKEV